MGKTVFCIIFNKYKWNINNANDEQKENRRKKNHIAAYANEDSLFIVIILLEIAANTFTANCPHVQIGTGHNKNIVTNIHREKEQNRLSSKLKAVLRPYWGRIINYMKCFSSDILRLSVLPWAICQCVNCICPKTTVDVSSAVWGISRTRWRFFLYISSLPKFMVWSMFGDDLMNGQILMLRLNKSTVFGVSKTQHNGNNKIIKGYRNPKENNNNKKQTKIFKY